jgi:beta-phosphoglucomutase-like phosphatase (HAD superfamily)
MEIMKKIKGVIYDLDGTIISTQKLHESAWIYAAKKLGLSITEKMLFDQRGISDEISAAAILPSNKRNLINDFVEIKKSYVNDNIDKISIFPGTIETIHKLKNKKINVYICTSARENFVRKILEFFPELKECNIIWREMYKNEKPMPESLNLTIKKMGINNSQVIYIGDALNDYKTSINANVRFIYFYPKENSSDARIPKDVFVISSHKEIVDLLDKF